MNNWRLIISAPASGAWNMAIDEALLECAHENPDTPTLRLYSWNPYSLSLGHAQPFSDVSEVNIQSRGWDIVRRPTGGRAILHADELTYALVFNENHTQLKGGVLESYRKISAGLICGLKLLGINAQSKLKDTSSALLSRDAICFQHPSDYELTIFDKKIIGSAQARRNGGVLQHGAIPLFGDITRIMDVLVFPDEQQRNKIKENLLQRAATLSDVLNYRVTWNQVTQTLIQGFNDTFKINLLRTTISPKEIALAERLYQDKHTTAEWIKRI